MQINYYYYYCYYYLTPLVRGIPKDIWCPLTESIGYTMQCSLLDDG